MTRHYLVTYTAHSQIVYSQRPIAEIRRVFGDHEGYKIYRGKDLRDAVEEKLVEEHKSQS